MEIKQKYKTKKVVIIVVDGPRLQETWNSPSRNLIQVRDSLSKLGVFFTDFGNDGETLTNPGHVAITTGVYQSIDNSGFNYPNNPSVFQYYLKSTGKKSQSCQVVTSKDKLHILANTTHPQWSNKYTPEINCGVNGPNTGNRDDYETYYQALKTLAVKKPDIMLIQFKDPDIEGHMNNWNGYLQAIKTTDQYIGYIWKFLQTSSDYRGVTSVFITNDHGRHNDYWSNGFVSHGDNCSGCRQIELLAIGPDFKPNSRITTHYNQSDLIHTIGKLMDFYPTYANGKVIKELFK